MIRNIFLADFKCIPPGSPLIPTLIILFTSNSEINEQMKHLLTKFSHCCPVRILFVGGYVRQNWLLGSIFLLCLVLFAKDYVIMIQENSKRFTFILFVKIEIKERITLLPACYFCVWVLSSREYDWKNV